MSLSFHPFCVTVLCWIESVWCDRSVDGVLHSESVAINALCVFSSIMKFQLPGPLVTSSFDCPHHHYLLTRPLGTSKCEQNDENMVMLSVLLRWHLHLSEEIILRPIYIRWILVLNARKRLEANSLVSYATFFFLNPFPIWVILVYLVLAPEL